MTLDGCSTERNPIVTSPTTRFSFFPRDEAEQAIRNAEAFVAAIRELIELGPQARKTAGRP
jgi:hypothetical protein